MSEIRQITIGICRPEKEGHGYFHFEGVRRTEDICQRQMSLGKGKVRKYTTLLGFKLGVSVGKYIVIKCNIASEPPNIPHHHSKAVTLFSKAHCNTCSSFS